MRFHLHSKKVRTASDEYDTDPHNSTLTDAILGGQKGMNWDRKFEAQGRTGTRKKMSEHSINASKRHEQQSLPPTVNPEPLDVLLGRGRGNYEHKGNKRFQEVIDKYEDQFNAANGKSEKSRITQAIIDETSRTGRFLRLDIGAGGWVEADDDLARLKVIQALRYRQKAKRKGIPEKYARGEGDEDSKPSAQAFQPVPEILASTLTANISSLSVPPLATSNPAQTLSSSRNEPAVQTQIAGLHFSVPFPDPINENELQRRQNSHSRLPRNTSETLSDMHWHTSAVSNAPQNSFPHSLTGLVANSQYNSIQTLLGSGMTASSSTFEPTHQAYVRNFTTQQQGTFNLLLPPANVDGLNMTQQQPKNTEGQHSYPSPTVSLPEAHAASSTPFSRNSQREVNRMLRVSSGQHHSDVLTHPDFLSSWFGVFDTPINFQDESEAGGLDPDHVLSGQHGDRESDESNNPKTQHG